MSMVTLALPLLQVPPAMPSARLVVRPSHTSVLPVIAAGNGSTVIIVVEIQLVGSVYVIVEVQTAIPVITPVAASMEVKALLLLHTPPGVTSLSVALRP